VICLSLTVSAVVVPRKGFFKEERLFSLRGIGQLVARGVGDDIVEGIVDVGRIERGGVLDENSCWLFTLPSA
jgi:hypothetical protein